MTDETAKDDDALAAAVAAVVEQQRDARLDIVNEGEYTKNGDWLSFVEVASMASRPVHGPKARFR
jgi:hypothetical protein